MDLQVVNDCNTANVTLRFREFKNRNKTSKTQNAKRKSQIANRLRQRTLERNAIIILAESWSESFSPSEEFKFKFFSISSATYDQKFELFVTSAWHFNFWSRLSNYLAILWFSDAKRIFYWSLVGTFCFNALAQLTGIAILPHITRLAYFSSFTQTVEMSVNALEA